MAFSANAGAGMANKCDMNVVPLIDVLLVLLIIFMVTVPAVSYQIQVDLPQATRSPPPTTTPPPPIRLRIDGGGQLFWDNTPIPRAALMPQMQLEAAREIQPTLEIQTSPDAQYQVLASVLATARNAGLEKIGFVDDR
ncbi:ExbD/TolR family protein [Alkalisalibacterium limincola]|uniref:Biopolymer transporter ExbD n=1 Tax=Alkalisalibacterium limincola TaxID=2699169 RepID=A0A5C8KKW2_9GAMM|nr:biopolymer transporter ExbD [Alkalisalibacterium limincola]